MNQPVTFSTDPQLCRQCGGRCCQGHPGVWTDPERFVRDYFHGCLPAREQMVTRLTERGLNLRDLDGVLIPAPLETSAGCIFHGPDGCSLPEERRPDQCRALRPSLDTLLDDSIHCTLPPEHGSDTARKRWRAYWSRA